MQRLVRAKSHYYPWTTAQEEMVLPELRRGQGSLAGLFCRQLEAQKSGMCCYRPEVTWAEGDGMIRSGFFLSFILPSVTPIVQVQ